MVAATTPNAMVCTHPPPCLGPWHAGHGLHASNRAGRARRPGAGRGCAAHPALLVPPVGEREDEPDAVARGLGQQQVVALHRDLVVHARRHLDRLVVLGRLIALAHARAHSSPSAAFAVGQFARVPSAPAQARVATWHGDLSGERPPEIGPSDAWPCMCAAGRAGRIRAA